MSKTRRQMLPLAALLVVALVVRLAFAWWWQYHHLPPQKEFEFADSESYWELGRQIADGRPYQFRSPDRKAFRAPGYPVVLAGLWLIGGKDTLPVHARWLGAVLGTAAVALVYLWGATAFGQTRAMSASVIAAFYPGAIATSALVLAEAPFCLWMLLQLLLWHLALQKDRIWLSLGSGFAAGLAVLTRPSWLLFLPLYLACLVGYKFFVKRSELPRLLKLGGVSLAGLVLVMTPWTVRNWFMLGRPIPTTLQVGASLYDGLNPQADGSSNMAFVEGFVAELAAEDRNRNMASRPDEPFEVRLDIKMRRAALQWATSHPGAVLELAAVKFARMWNPWPNEPSFRRWQIGLPVALSFLTVMLLAAFSSWSSRARPGVLALFWAPAVYFSLLHVVFVGSVRYRQPAMLPLMVLAGAGAVSLKELTVGLPHAKQSHQ